MDSAVLDMTPEMLHNIPQPDFEQIIANELSHNPGLVELRKNVSFVSLVQEDDHVTTVVQERDTGESYSIKSRFVVACDGHRSAVRDFLKIESEGESAFETMMTIHFHADLRSVVGSRVGILHWMMDPMVSGVLIAYDLGRNLVLLCNFDPEKQPVGTWTEDLCLKLVKAAIGPATPIQIQSWRPWALSRQVAKSYRTGNVFLAGDAAHSFPPTGGLGLNSGIADVHNLAYKLAAVLQGWADPSILSTYEFERRQVALVNSAQSLKNGKQILSLLKTLGTGTSNMTEARRNLHKVLCDKDQRVKIDRSISEQQEHFDNVSLDRTL